VKTLSYQGDNYNVRLTRPKRKCDVARFVVQKQGGKTYTVTFQDTAGNKGMCDCKAGMNRKRCRHQNMLAEFVVKASQAKVANKPAPQPKPKGKVSPDQMALPLGNPAEDQYRACRVEYIKLLEQKAEIEAALKKVEAQGKALKARLGKAAA